MYKFFGLPVWRIEHDMQNDEVMCHLTIQGFAGYRNPFNSRPPQNHASIDTRENNGSLWRHNS